MKKFIIFLTILLLLAGCSDEKPAATQPPETTQAPTQAPTETAAPKTRADIQLVILLPDEETLYWGEVGPQLQEMLGNYFYDAQLYYANSNPREQAKQITEAVEAGVDGIILAPVESAALLDACQLAQEAGIPIFSYDRLLMDTEAVTYYVSLDYYAMGAEIGEQIISQATLADLEEGSQLTIEFLMGSPEDPTALFLYNGVMDQLRPYLEKEILVAKSGRIALEDTCVVDWDPITAGDNFRSYLKEYYNGKAPDIICTVDDNFAGACIAVLEEKRTPVPPVITGVGGGEDSSLNIADGVQSLTLRIDRTELNQRLAATVDAVISGQTPELNDTDNCFNNVTTVPAYLCGYEVITPET